MKLLTREETAKHLRISLTTLAELQARGEIPFSKSGPGVTARVTFEQDDLDAYIDRKKIDRSEAVENIVGPLRGLSDGLTEKRDFALSRNFPSSEAFRRFGAVSENVDTERKYSAGWIPDDLQKNLDTVAENIRAAVELFTFESDGLEFADLEKIAERQVGHFEKIKRRLESDPSPLRAEFFNLPKGLCLYLKTRDGGEGLSQIGVGHSAADYARRGGGGSLEADRVVAEKTFIINGDWSAIPALELARPGELRDLFNQRPIFEIQIAAAGAPPLSRADRARADAEREAKRKEKAKKISKNLKSEVLKNG